MKTKDLLNEKIIKSYLDREDISLSVYPVLPSTSDLAKALAKEGADAGTVILAEKQTAGRGRRGKRFFSPEASGVYLSIILKPDILPSEGYKITISAAVAVCKALEEMDIKPQIKWVNDIFLEGKKVAGILTEAIFKDGKLDFSVLGVGINFYQPKDGFPEDISLSASYLWETPEENRKNKFVAAFLNNLTDFTSETLEEYRHRLIILGKDILVGEKQIPAKALDITDTAGLLIEYENGEKVVLDSGEISIKPII